jgi:hypothetical protein
MLPDLAADITFIDACRFATRRDFTQLQRVVVVRMPCSFCAL